MSSVVLELQRDALDPNVRVSDLLRKALVVAQKLSLTEFAQVIDAELKGYRGEDDIPSYRELSGEVRGLNPVRGWVPVMFENRDLADSLSKRSCYQSIAELEHLLDNQPEGSELHIPFPQDVQLKLSRGFGFPTQVSLFVQRTEIIGIIDTVRNIVLNWALKLEEDGVLGEGLSFSPEEKHIAAQSPQNVMNFHGPVHNPQFQQGGSYPTQVSVHAELNPEAVRALADAIRSALDSLPLTKDQSEEVEAELATVEAQLKSPKPKPAIIWEALRSLRRALEAAGGAVAAKLLLELARVLPG